MSDSCSMLELIVEAVRSLNEELGYDQLDQPGPDTLLYDGDEALDSLSLVMLIADVEERIENVFSCEVVLASEKAMSMRNSPYRSVATLSAFALSEMAEQQRTPVSVSAE